jgi:hypothetical protein
MFEVKSYVADCLKQKYHRPCITVMEGCCRKCLRGTPAGYNIKKKPINELMDEGIIDPYQMASAFHIGSAYQTPYFKDIVINMKSEERPCKYPGNCNLTCVLCFSLIMNSDGVELDIWPGFQVHKACTTPCLYPCCRQRLPTLPAYLSLQRSTLMCDLHKAFQKLTIPALPKKPIYPPPKPISLPQPLPEPKSCPLEPKSGPSEPKSGPSEPKSGPSEPKSGLSVVKKTFSFKKQPRAKADKFERGNNASILNFFPSPKADAKKIQDKIQETALAASKRDDAPRRFLRNKETGVIFGYWKGDQKFRLDNDEPLEFKSSQYPSYEKPYGSNITFDFTPPITLSNPSNDESNP